MRKEEAGDFPVRIVPVDLEESEKRMDRCNGRTM